MLDSVASDEIMEDKSKIASEKQKSFAERSLSMISSHEYRAGVKGQDGIDTSSTVLEIGDEQQGNVAEE